MFGLNYLVKAETCCGSLFLNANCVWRVLLNFISSAYYLHGKEL